MAHAPQYPGTANAQLTIGVFLVHFSVSRLSALALCASLATPVLAQNANSVLATVGGVDITLGHLIVATENLPDQYQKLPDEVLFTGILDQLIQQQALSLSLGDELSTRAKLGLANEMRAYRANIVLQGAGDAAATDEAIQASYDEAIGNADAQLEYDAAHILVETEEEALALITQLEGGADFAELAQEFSTGPSGPNGGALGWFGAGRMVPEFEAAVITLEVGGVSAPVQTQFGWHVVKLNETRELEALSLDEVREELSNGLREAAVQEAMIALTESVEVERPEIDIDPTMIRDTSLVD
ncbi:MAG: peptidyl-prolyl cis-trans isomerase C [Dinoroseobacter sp.]